MALPPALQFARPSNPLPTALTFLCLQQQQHPRQPVAAASAAADAVQGGDNLSDAVSEVARQNLKKAANACRRYGWISFWVQLVLNTVAAVVLLFSLAFTSQVGAGYYLGGWVGGRGCASSLCIFFTKAVRVAGRRLMVLQFRASLAFSCSTFLCCALCLCCCPSPPPQNRTAPQCRST